ncbi:MAG: phosphoribosyl-AMP cyclohydrolase, partial [Gammaproteobacteria bacterium]|nr:phosphoribosyl-AMP cyclohydrolase [Gammaproteobacteria bacterium]
MTDAAGIARDINWNAQGLVPAIAQDWQTGEVLMLAWMNREAMELTVSEGRAIYWSRSRQALWRKGEESGHVQLLKELRIDCDTDTVLLRVEQVGGIACHTGRRSCFYRKWERGDWQVTDEILRSPETIYG